MKRYYQDFGHAVPPGLCWVLRSVGVLANLILTSALFHEYAGRTGHTWIFRCSRSAWARWRYLVTVACYRAKTLGIQSTKAIPCDLHAIVSGLRERYYLGQTVALYANKFAHHRRPLAGSGRDNRILPSVSEAYRLGLISAWR